MKEGEREGKNENFSRRKSIRYIAPELVYGHSCELNC